MSGPGYVFTDSGLTPPQTPSQSEQDRYPVEGSNLTSEQRSKAQKQPITISEQVKQQLIPDSHETAQKSTVIDRAIRINGQRKTDTQPHDTGWHQTNERIPDPLLEDIPNGELFSLIRRFNKDIFAVKSVSEASRGLDLAEAWDDEYPSDKITLNLQRVYLTIVLGVFSFLKHVSRIRSWKESKRTAGFFAMYSIAWHVDYLVPLALGTLMLIISSKKARDVLFPPAPRSLVSISTGGIQKPQAGQLGTSDTLTGAPESQEGEAVQEEASKFVENVRHLVQKTIGMHEKEKNQGDPLESKIPKPLKKAVSAIKGAGTSSGHATGEKGQTEEPMEELLWDKLSPEKLEPIFKKVPHVVGEIADNWERFGNAISPTPPFTRLSYLRIDGLLLPLFLGSFFISSYLVNKFVGFAVGFMIFGDPVLAPSTTWVNRKFPRWMNALEPKNNILRGVPTNNQLTLTLLRIGEANKTPLPPLPTSNKDSEPIGKDVDLKDITLSATDAEKHDALHPSASKKSHSSETGEQENEPKHTHLSKITRIFQKNTKAAVSTKLAADKVRAAAGNETAKGHLGVLPKISDVILAGPSDFKGRLNGKEGWLSITTDARPSLIFTTQDCQPDGNIDRGEIELNIIVDEITTLKRAAAFGNSWGEKAANVSDEKRLLGSLEVEDQEGKVWRFTALPERDELFNRLISLGGQRWENL